MHNFDYSSNNAADAATTATKTTTTCMLLLLLLLPLLLYYNYLLLPFKRRLFKGYFTNRFRLEYFQSYITSSLYHFLIGRHNTNAKCMETYVIYGRWRNLFWMHKINVHFSTLDLYVARTKTSNCQLSVSFI